MKRQKPKAQSIGSLSRYESLENMNIGVNLSIDTIEELPIVERSGRRRNGGLKASQSVVKLKLKQKQKTPLIQSNQPKLQPETPYIDAAIPDEQIATKDIMVAEVEPDVEV